METRENQHILLWTWCRTGPGRPTKKFSILVKANKIEVLTNNFYRIYFRDPFTKKKAVVLRRGYQQVDLSAQDGGIRGFEGFVNRPKRVRKKVNKIQAPTDSKTPLPIEAAPVGIVENGTEGITQGTLVRYDNNWTLTTASTAVQTHSTSLRYPVVYSTVRNEVKSQ